MRHYLYKSLMPTDVRIWTSSQEEADKTGN
jgi:hypothetical protein